MFLPRRLIRAALRALSPGGVSPLYERAKADAADFIKFPCYPPRMSRLERAMLRSSRGLMTCTVCGAFCRFDIRGDNLREDCCCSNCGATNRHRQLAWVLCSAIAQSTRKSLAGLPTLRLQCGELAIYNTEARGPVHDQLAPMPRYRCSEYFGPSHKSGDLVNGVMHQDLQRLSFPDATFDVVLSSDVFEHIPDPYLAHREVMRVLKPAGRHVFTVPFVLDGHLDQVRARIGSNGLEHLHPSIYHLDPVTGKADVLVFTIFGLEMLVRLRSIGFSTELYQLSAPWLGILGQNAIVFDARRV